MLTILLPNRKLDILSLVRWMLVRTCHLFSAKMVTKKKKETEKSMYSKIASRVAVELTSHWLMPGGPDPDGHCGNCRGSINLSLGKNLITPKIVIAGSVGGHFDGWCLSKIAWRIINSKWFNNVSDSAPSQRLSHESGICTKQKYAPLEYHKNIFCVISSK